MMLWFKLFLLIFGGIICFIGFLAIIIDLIDSIGKIHINNENKDKENKDE